MSEWDNINDITLFALCLWGEARGEPIEAKVGCGNVIWNRHTLWGKPLRDVILRPKQFSCFNEGDPNLNKIRSIRDSEDLNDAAYWECYWVCYGIMYDYLGDNTKGATHYNTIACDPKWDDNMVKTATYGHTEYFREA